MADEIRKRNEIEDRYKWDLTHIFTSDEAWEKEYDEAMAETQAVAALDGHVAEDPRKAIIAVQKLFDRILPVYEYAFLRKETDNTDPAAQALKDKAMRLYVTAMTCSSFLQPELLELSEEELKALAADPAMKDYDAELRRLLLSKPHTLPKEQERLIAMMGEVAEAPDSIFSALSDADMKFPPVRMPDGSEQELTEGNYSTFIRSDDRDVRRQAFHNIMSTYESLGNTVAGIYGTSVKKDQFMAMSHHYASAREAAMKPLEIPESVYDNLIEAVHEYLPVLQDYLRLRKEMLQLDELHLYDLYTPIVKGFRMDLPYEKAFDLVLEGLRPMGEDYIAKLKEARDGRWIDVYPSVGKSSGAFSAGSLREVHPYVLLNHNNNLDSAFTIAHELGHSMHSYYSNTAQPSPKSDYSLFVAEVASTCNEAVMQRYLTEKMAEPAARAFLLNHLLEQFRTTVFRQTMFAEFEKISHEMAAQGLPLTKKSLSDAYFALNEKYYGETCFMDPEIASEWMRIPHFYRAFYVYVYATGLCAAISLSRKILQEGESAVKDYRKFLSAGCSVPPIEALKLAGIDMSRPKPIRDALEVFRETVQQMREVAGKLKQ